MKKFLAKKKRKRKKKGSESVVSQPTDETTPYLLEEYDEEYTECSVVWEKPAWPGSERTETRRARACREETLMMTNSDNLQQNRLVHVNCKQHSN